jgi:hypothetical protein
VITDATDYFPFGAPNRTVSSTAGYRYGFNGKELDKSMLKGQLNINTPKETASSLLFGAIEQKDLAMKIRAIMIQLDFDHKNKLHGKKI